MTAIDPSTLDPTPEAMERTLADLFPLVRWEAEPDLQWEGTCLDNEGRVQMVFDVAPYHEEGPRFTVHVGRDLQMTLRGGRDWPAPEFFLQVREHLAAIGAAFIRHGRLR